MNSVSDIFELARFQENLKSFSGHAGRPGHRGGSSPRSGIPHSDSSPQTQFSSSISDRKQKKNKPNTAKLADSLARPYEGQLKIFTDKELSDLHSQMSNYKPSNHWNKITQKQALLNIEGEMLSRKKK